MNRLFKPIFAVAFLVLGGCAHHTGYYGGGYGGAVSSYSAYRPYPVYYGRPGHVHKSTVVKKYYIPGRVGRSHDRKRHDWNHRYDRRRDSHRSRRSSHGRSDKDRHFSRRHHGSESRYAGNDTPRRAPPRHTDRRHSYGREPTGGRRHNDRFDGNQRKERFDRRR